MYLLDISVLIALADPAHVHASSAQHFFSASAVTEGWATCPLVENGFLRIFGHLHYPGGPASPELAREILKGIIASPGHRFLPDSVSLCDAHAYPTLPHSRSLTDAYLLALAVKNHARFATLDSKINVDVIKGGQAAYHLIPIEG